MPWRKSKKLNTNWKKIQILHENLAKQTTKFNIMKTNYNVRHKAYVLY